MKKLDKEDLSTRSGGLTFSASIGLGGLSVSATRR